MKQLNTYSYASGEVSDAENLIECIEANRRGYASISIYNLSGSAIPVMKAGSTVEIGGTIYTAEADEAAKFYNGTTFLDATYANVPSGTYFLALVPSSANNNETTELTLCIMTISSYEYNQDYRGWYQTNTLNRIIGGLTIANSGSAIAASEKWLMTHCHMSYTLEDPANPYFRLYSDGVEGVLRINTSHLSLYASSDTTDHGTTAVEFADFVASCPSRLVVPITSITLGDNYQDRFTSAYTVSLIALDRAGNELGVLGSTDFVVTGTSTTRNAVFSINPGRHKVRFTPKITTNWGYGTSITLTVRTTAISAYLTEVYGARKGTY